MKSFSISNMVNLIPISKSEIMAKYHDVPGFYGVEPLDLYIFETFVTQHYFPSESPLVMAVGAGSEEAIVARQFHHRNYGITLDKVIVAGCNIRPRIDEEKEEYDYVTDGYLGDARLDPTWREASFRFGRNKFDLAIVRFPDLINLPDWFSIFGQALFHVRPEGAVVTYVMGTDVPKLEKLLDMIDKEFQLKPTHRGWTGILDDDVPYNYHHTVAVLKPNAKSQTF